MQTKKERKNRKKLKEERKKDRKKQTHKQSDKQTVSLTDLPCGVTASTAQWQGVRPQNDRPGFELRLSPLARCQYTATG